MSNYLIPIYAFYPTQKHPSWIKVPVNEWPNDEWDGAVWWKAPINFPYLARGDGQRHWDEDLYQSDNTKGWVEIE